MFRPLLRKFLCRLERIVYNAAGGEYHRVAAVAQHIGLAEFKAIIVVMNVLKCLPCQSQESGILMIGQEAYGGLGLAVICRLYDGHVGESPHERNVFERHLAVAVLANGNAAMRSDHGDVGFAVTDGHADDFETSNHESGERTDKRFFPAQGHARGGADHVLLLYAHLEKSFGIHRGEHLRLCRFGKVGVEHNDVGVRRPELDQLFSERNACCFCHAAVVSCLIE
jgi:hypothetical protein